MKKILLLFLLATAVHTALAGEPLRISGFDAFVDGAYTFQRSPKGGAVDPLTHTGCVPQDGSLEIEFLDGGSVVYIKNLVYGSEKEFGDYWIYGNVDHGNEIYIPLGQVIYSDRGTRQAVLGWGTVSYNAATGACTFIPDATATAIVYNMDDKSILIENTSGPVVLNDQDEFSYQAAGPSIIWQDANGEYDGWAGYTEWGTELPYFIDWQPEGELKTYNRTSDCIHYNYANWSKSSNASFSHEQLSGQGEIVFAHDGKTVYIKDPLLSMDYGTWVAGTLNEDGSIITVNLAQLLYCSDDIVIFSKGDSHISSSYQPDGTMSDVIVVEDQWAENITYSIQGNTITLQDTWANFGASYPDNYMARGLYAYDNENNVGAIEANIVYYLQDEPVAVTSAPVINGYAINEGHAYCIEITPTEPSTIYYRLQDADGNLTAWMTYDFPVTISAAGEYRIEAYAQANGKQPSSHVTHDFSVDKATGISETAAGKLIVNKRYLNVMGQEIGQPEGLTIVVTTYSDGSTSTVKVMK